MRLINKIIWTLQHPLTAMAIHGNRLKSHFQTKKDTLFYLGMNKGDTFDTLFRSYKRCYGFEANPELFSQLQKRYQPYPHVTLIHAAVCHENGEVTFNISDNENAGSSSIGTFNTEWNQHRKTAIEMKKSVTVPALNLYDFCQEHGIDHITDYISDIQGMDYTALHKLAPMIANKQIESITCEVSKNGKQIYQGTPDNSLDSFQKLLEENYRLVATGSCLRSEDKLEPVPESWWEMDCRWRLKK